MSPPFFFFTLKGEVLNVTSILYCQAWTQLVPGLNASSQTSKVWVDITTKSIEAT